MDQDETLDVQGRWWLPGQTLDDGIPGTLRFDPVQGGSLVLNGHLRRHEEFGLSTREGDTTTTTFTVDSMEAAGTYEFILGQAHNKAFTLHDSFQSSSNRTFGGGDSRETITVNGIYRGAHFGPPGPMAFDRAFVGMRHLVQWVSPGQITGGSTWGDDARTYSLEGRPQPSADDFTTSDGYSVRLIRSIRLGGDRLALFTLAQDCRWQITFPDVVNDRRLLDPFSWLQDLVSFGTDRTAQFVALAFQHPQVSRAFPHDVSVRSDIDYFGRWSARDESDRPSPAPREHMFTFDQIGGMSGVEKWLAVAPKFRASLARIGASRYARGLYVSDILLHRTAALESFDRVKTGTSQSRFRTRLGRCLDLAGEDFAPFLSDRDRWVTLVIDARDDAAHQLDALADDAVDFMLVESLYWLFVICILKEAGLPREAIDHLTSTQHFGWLSQNVHNLTTP